MAKSATRGAVRVTGIRVSPLALPFAVQVARAHADIGLAEFNTLQNVVGTANTPTAELLLRVRYAIPAVTSLTLALELFLKIIHFQYYETYPRKGHNLTAIARSLPCIDLMRQQYADLRARQPYLRVATYELALNPVARAARAARPDSFDTALGQANDLYGIWRYFYESVYGAGLKVDFGKLLALIDTAGLTIDKHKGNARVSVGGPAASPAAASGGQPVQG
jgi:hypothetical protein